MMLGQALYTRQIWFAWRPVRLVDGRWAWLRRVERFRDGVGSWGFYFYRYFPLGAHGLTVDKLREAQKMLDGAPTFRGGPLTREQKAPE